jgi:hypothetical protein
MSDYIKVSQLQKVMELQKRFKIFHHITITPSGVRMQGLLGKGVLPKFGGVCNFKCLPGGFLEGNIDGIEIVLA